ncbi:MAG: DUF86 domain-containing protein [Bacteroidetes bacterium]|nr:DUF86 domain-containing protein [Bacteroidota bacterium]
MKNNQEESLIRLTHIINSLEKIKGFTLEIQEEEFASNEMLFNAVLLQFIIIGEAIVHVEKVKLEKYDYPWFKIRAFRNFIAHEYFDINPHAVWKIIIQDVPELKAMVEKVILNEF